MFLPEYPPLGIMMGIDIFYTICSLFPTVGLMMAIKIYIVHETII